jgi:hypothetical protein
MRMAVSLPSRSENFFYVRFGRFSYICRSPKKKYPVVTYFIFLQRRLPSRLGSRYAICISGIASCPESHSLYFIIVYTHVKRVGDQLKCGFRDQLKCGFRDQLKCGFRDQLECGLARPTELRFPRPGANAVSETN